MAKDYSGVTLDNGFKVIEQCSTMLHGRGTISVWKAECICGSIIERPVFHLKKLKGCSCGRPHELHGKGGTAIYKCWDGMKSRCHNPNATGYSYYGGKGIKVCDRWRNSFLAFYEDMGDTPGKGYTVERIDSTKDYKPSNCKWLPKNRQNRNTYKSPVTEDSPNQLEFYLRK